MHELNANVNLNPNQRHDIDIVVDRIIIKADIENRVAQAVDTALSIGDGSLIVHIVSTATDTSQTEVEGDDELFSTTYACPQCQLSYEVPEPRHFSFNSPYGMCKECQGLGVTMGILPKLIVPDDTVSIQEGAITLWGELEYSGNERIGTCLSNVLGIQS